MNAIVTASHITVVAAYTISQVTAIFMKTLLEKTRIDSAFYFFGGLADMFLTIMLWFIFDDDKKTMMVTDEHRVYAVHSDMIAGIETTINLYEKDEGEEDDDVQVQGGKENKSALSKVMFDQFIIQEEVKHENEEGETYDWFCLSCRRCSREYEQEDEYDAIEGDQ